jgi:hypothetical protein
VGTRYALENGSDHRSSNDNKTLWGSGNIGAWAAVLTICIAAKAREVREVVTPIVRSSCKTAVHESVQTMDESVPGINLHNARYCCPQMLSSDRAALVARPRARTVNDRMQHASALCDGRAVSFILRRNNDRIDRGARTWKLGRGSLTE